MLPGLKRGREGRAAKHYNSQSNVRPPQTKVWDRPQHYGGDRWLLIFLLTEGKTVHSPGGWEEKKSKKKRLLIDSLGVKVLFFIRTSPRGYKKVWNSCTDIFFETDVSPKKGRRKKPKNLNKHRDTEDDNKTWDNNVLLSQMHPHQIKQQWDTWEDLDDHDVII